MSCVFDFGFYMCIILMSLCVHSLLLTLYTSTIVSVFPKVCISTTYFHFNQINTIIVYVSVFAGVCAIFFMTLPFMINLSNFIKGAMLQTALIKGLTLIKVISSE